MYHVTKHYFMTVSIQIVQLPPQLPDYLTRVVYWAARECPVAPQSRSVRPHNLSNRIQ